MCHRLYTNIRKNYSVESTVNIDPNENISSIWRRSERILLYSWQNSGRIVEKRTTDCQSRFLRNKRKKTHEKYNRTIWTGERYEKADFLSQFVEEYKRIITNTWFQPSARRHLESSWRHEWTHGRKLNCHHTCEQMLKSLKGYTGADKIPFLVCSKWKWKNNEILGLMYNSKDANTTTIPLHTITSTAISTERK